MSTPTLCAAAAGVAIGLLLHYRHRKRKQHILPSERTSVAAVPTAQLNPAEFEVISKDRVLRRIETVLQRRTQKVVMVLERLNNGHNYAAILRTCETFGVQYVYLVSPPRSEDELFDSAAKAQKRAADIELVQRERAKAAARGASVGNDENDDGGGNTTSRRHRRRMKRLAAAATFVADEELGTDASHIAFARRALRFLTLRTFDSAGACLDALHAEGREVWATDLGQEAVVLAPGAPWLSEAGALPKKLALVIGTESTGVSREMLQRCDRRVYLPQNGFADSLNASVAAALTLQTTLLLYGASACGDLYREASAETLRTLRLKWIAELARDEQHALAMSLAVSDHADAMPQPLDDLRRADAFRVHTGRPVATERRRVARQQQQQAALTASAKQT